MRISSFHRGQKITNEDILVTSRTEKRSEERPLLTVHNYFVSLNNIYRLYAINQTIRKIYFLKANSTLPRKIRKIWFQHFEVKANVNISYASLIQSLTMLLFSRKKLAVTSIPSYRIGLTKDRLRSRDQPFHQKIRRSKGHQENQVARLKKNRQHQIKQSNNLII